MNNQRLIAYAVLGLGVLALINHMTGGASWLWLALVAAGFLGSYIRYKHYSLLVTGCILAGLAVGQLLEPWGPAALFISLATGFVVLERLEPRKERWPLQVAGALSAIGLVIGLSSSGILTPLWLALLISAVGLVLVIWSVQDGGWVKVPDKAPAKERLDTGVLQVAPTVSETSETARSVSKATTATTAASTTASEKVAVRAAEESVESASVESASVESASVESGGVESGGTESGGAELREKLERWRRDTAKKEDRAAYLILTNETLQSLVQAQPRTRDELAAIKGIGPVKLERYGEAIIALIKAAS